MRVNEYLLILECSEMESCELSFEEIHTEVTGFPVFMVSNYFPPKVSINAK